MEKAPYRSHSEVKRIQRNYNGGLNQIQLESQYERKNPLQI